jgi:hypothetical protein
MEDKDSSVNLGSSILTAESLSKIAVIRHTLMTGLAHNPAIHALDEIAAERAELLQAAFRRGVDAARGGAVLGRVLAPNDPFCPKCGHNRDTSSVSSVDLGDGWKGCQFCGTEWKELPDADAPHRPMKDSPPSEADEPK